VEAFGSKESTSAIAEDGSHQPAQVLTAGFVGRSSIDSGVNTGFYSWVSKIALGLL